MQTYAGPMSPTVGCHGGNGFCTLPFQRNLIRSNDPNKRQGKRTAASLCQAWMLRFSEKPWAEPA
jgi:hypothetical protein